MTRARNSANLASQGNLFVDIANDRTGIGSVVPAQNLHVAGTAGFHADVTFTGDLYNATWDRSDNSLKFVDNTKIKIGTDGDLTLHHDGSHSRIRDVGTGNLNIQSNTTAIQNAAGSQNCAVFIENGTVGLYHASALKFETTAYGTNTTGTAVNDGLVVAGVATVTTMNVTGVLTYDDVTSVDSVGIVTARQGIHIDDSIVHIGDTNTKIRFPSNDQISFETGGSEHMKVAGTNITLGTNSTTGHVLQIKNRGNDCNNTVALGLDIQAAWMRIGDAISGGATYGNGLGIKFHDSGVVHWSIGKIGSSFNISNTSNSGTELFPSSRTDALVLTSAGNATFSGNLTVSGNLSVTGTTTQNNSVSTAQKTITLASGAANNAAVDGAGLVIDAGSDTDKTLKWLDSTDRWTFTGGDVSANAYYGDGSNLTGVTQTTINNNANNRIITGSGTADTLEAESSITYDGTKVLNISSSAGGFYQGTDTDGGVGLLEMGNGNVALQADTGNSIGSSKIQFFVDGSEKAKIDDGGRLLVGSAAMQYAASPLYVSATGPVQGTFHSSSGGTNDQARIALGALANNPPYQRGVYLTAENNGAGHDFIVSCSASHSAGPSDKLRITSAGDVAIGRDAALNNYAAGSTTTKLAVAKDAAGSGYCEIANFTGGSDADDTGAIVRIGQFGNDRGLYIKAGRGTLDQAKAIFGLRNSSAGEADVMTFLQGGVVGINNGSPTQGQLVVSNSSGNTIALCKTGNAGAIALGGPSQPRILMEAAQSSSDLLIYTAQGSSWGTPTWQEKFRITSSGFVGINETSPDNALHVKSTSDTQQIKVENTTSSGRAQIRYFNPHADWQQGIIGGTTDGDFITYTSQARNARIYTNNTERARFKSTGEIILGNVSNTGGVSNSALHIEAAGMNVETGYDYDDASGGAPHLTLSGQSTRVRMDMGTMNVAPYGAWIQARYDNNPFANSGTDRGREPLALNPRGGAVTFNLHDSNATNEIGGGAASTQGGIVMRAGRAVSPTVNNASTAIKIFPGEVRAYSGTGAVGEQNEGTKYGGIAWNILDPHYSSWGDNHDGHHCWMGMSLHSTPNQEKSNWQVQMNSTASAGSYATNVAIQANPEGYITHPCQPYASTTLSNTTSGNMVTHNTVLTNNGSHFNTSNSRFICPINGFYLVSFMAMTNNSNDTMDIELRKNGSNANNILVPYQSNTGSNYNQVSGTCIIECAKNDYLQFKVNNGSVYSGRHSAQCFALLG